MAKDHEAVVHVAHHSRKLQLENMVQCRNHFFRELGIERRIGHGTPRVLYLGLYLAERMVVESRMEFRIANEMQEALVSHLPCWEKFTDSEWVETRMS